MAGILDVFTKQDADEKKKKAEKKQEIKYVAPNAIPNYLTKRYMNAGGDAPQGGGSIRAFNSWLSENDYNIRVRE